MSEYWIEDNKGDKVFIDFLYCPYSLERVPLYFFYKEKYHLANIDISIWERGHEFIKMNPDNPFLLVNTLPTYELFTDSIEEIQLLFDDATDLGLLKKIGKNRVEIKIIPQSKLNSIRNYGIHDRWTIFRGDMKNIDQLLNHRLEEYFKRRFQGE